MKRKHVSSVILAAVLCISGTLLAVCPSADLTGDCFVDMEDLAALASQWLTGDRVPNDMVSLSGGTFQMGDSFDEGFEDELPVHTVTLSPFYIRKYGITNGQYCEYLNSSLAQGLITVISGVVYKSGSGTGYPYCDTSTATNDSQIAFSNNTFTARTKSGRSMVNDPMVQVSWYGAAAYCNWRSQREDRELCYDLSTWTCDFTKHGYRLPTEAEWEYAARGGLPGKRFPWGDTIDHSHANYCSSPSYTYDVSISPWGNHPTWSSGGITPYTSPVGSFPANGYGLYDMAGNGWGWCNDRYSNIYYNSSPTNNPTGPVHGTYRVLRGGDWSNYANGCRTTYRNYIPPDRRYYSYGFRILLHF